MFRKNRLSADGEVRPLVLLMLACICAYLVIVFSYFFGDPKHRLLHGFSFSPWRLGVVPILAHRAWPKFFNQRVLLAGSLGCFCCMPR